MNSTLDGMYVPRVYEETQIFATVVRMHVPFEQYYCSYISLYMPTAKINDPSPYRYISACQCILSFCKLVETGSFSSF